jgi:hypothetical protein
MSKPHTPSCTSCGYAATSVPGRRCSRPGWHTKGLIASKKLAGGIEQAREHQENEEGIMAANKVEGWVRARLRLLAYQTGQSTSAYLHEILSNHAAVNGGPP